MRTIAAALALGATVALAERAPADAGCPVSTLLCGTTMRGTIAGSDCAAGDGTRFDLWQFSGAAGQIVYVTFSPLPGTWNGTLEMLPLDASVKTAPAVTGSGTLSLHYFLPATGTWRLRVGASGEEPYLLSLACYALSDPAVPGCIDQRLSCGQSAKGSVTEQSCRFSNTGGVFAPITLATFRTGDVITLTAHSDDFDPSVNIYGDGTFPLARAHGVRSTQDAMLVFRVPANGEYSAAVHGSDHVGTFTLSVTCTLAPCFSAVAIRRQPQDVIVPEGGEAVLRVAADGDGKLVYQWYEGAPPDTTLPLFDGTGSELLIANVRYPRTFWVRVTSGCASADSVAATVAPPRSLHRRATKP